MEKLKISYPIIVEGKYDKIKLSSIIDGVIIETSSPISYVTSVLLLYALLFSLSGQTEQLSRLCLTLVVFLARYLALL